MYDIKLLYREFVLSLTGAIIDFTDTKLVLKTHTYGSLGEINNDLTACQENQFVFIGLAADRLSIHDLPYGRRGLTDTIGLADVFCGSQMHSCIPSFSQRVATEWIVPLSTKSVN